MKKKTAKIILEFGKNVTEQQKQEFRELGSKSIEQLAKEADKIFMFPSDIAGTIVELGRKPIKKK